MEEKEESDHVRALKLLATSSQLISRGPKQPTQQNSKSRCLFRAKAAKITWEKVGYWLGGKESTCQCRRHGFDPWVGEIPWRRKWHPTPVFLLGKFHGQRSLGGSSPWRAGQDLATKQQRIRTTGGNYYHLLNVFSYFPHWSISQKVLLMLFYTMCCGFYFSLLIF